MAGLRITDNSQPQNAEYRQGLNTIAAFLPPLGAGQWHNQNLGRAINFLYAAVVIFALYAVSSELTDGSLLQNSSGSAFTF